MRQRIAFPLPEVSGLAASPELTALRRAMAEAAAAGHWRSTPPAEEQALGGVRVLRFAASGPAELAVLHFHGGGYRMGMPEAAGPYARLLADRCGVDVWCPAYRLAPEHPFPAGLNDGWTVASALMMETPGRLVLSGDSAGGGLAASLTAELVASGMPPAGLVLHSPWLDLTVSSESYRRNADSDPLFSRASACEAAELYLQGHACDDPLVSPLFARLEGFPPTLITVGKGEVLCEDARRMYQRLQEGGSVRLLEIGGMDHVAVTRGLDLPGAASAFAATEAFIAALAPR